MAVPKEPWFVAERSEALAGLLLTSRPDVRVRSEDKKADGADLIVEINTGESLSTRLLVVQVRGTVSSEPADWMRNVERLFTKQNTPVYLPTCVVVVDVRSNRAQYAWLAEPSLGANGIALKFRNDIEFRDFDEAAVDEMIDRLKDWYATSPVPSPRPSRTPRFLPPDRSQTR